MSQGDRAAFEQVCPLCPCLSMQCPWMSCPNLLLSGGLICACPGVSSIILAGTPRSSLPLTQIIDQACQEAEAYKDAGVVSFGFFLPMTAITQNHFCIARILNWAYSSSKASWSSLIREMLKSTSFILTQEVGLLDYKNPKDKYHLKQLKKLWFKLYNSNWVGLIKSI